MVMKLIGQSRRAQTAIEYLLLLGVATAVALVGFRLLLPKVNNSSEVYFNQAANKLLDTPPGYAIMEGAKTYP